jgi:hypothetical protein
MSELQKKLNRKKNDVDSSSSSSQSQAPPPPEKVLRILNTYRREYRKKNSKQF